MSDHISSSRIQKSCQKYEVDLKAKTYILNKLNKKKSFAGFNLAICYLIIKFIKKKA